LKEKFDRRTIAAKLSSILKIPMKELTTMSQVEQATSSSDETPSLLLKLMAKLPEQARQRQDATNAQLETVEEFLVANDGSGLKDWEKAVIANRMGCYDAADIYKLRASQAEGTRA
jgi:hypothetical protein